MSIVNLHGGLVAIEQTIMAIEPTTVTLANGTQIMARIIPERLMTQVETRQVILQETGQAKAGSRDVLGLNRLSAV